MRNHVSRWEDLPPGDWLANDEYGVHWYRADDGSHWYSADDGYHLWEEENTQVVEEISEEVSSLFSSLSKVVSPSLLLPVLSLLMEAPTSTVNSIVEVLELSDASTLVMTSV